MRSPTSLMVMVRSKSTKALISGAAPFLARKAAGSARDGRGSNACFFVEADGHDLRDPFFFHRDAVEGARGFHRSLVMRNHDELGVAGKLLQNTRITVDIGIIERSVDLVENAERAGFHEINGEQKRDRRQRLFAAR